MANQKPTEWEYSKNSPIDNYGTIVKNGRSITTISPTNPQGYLQLDPSSNDRIVSRIWYAIDTNGKITYSIAASGSGLTPTDRKFNNIQEIAGAAYAGYGNDTTLKIKNAISKNLTDRYKSIVIDKQASASPYAVDPNAPATAPSPTDAPIDINIPTIAGKSQKNRGTFYYPLDINGAGQDKIKFTMYEVSGSTIKGNISNILSNNFTGKIVQRNKNTTQLGEVYLPIQPSIVDRNSVDWRGGELNAFDAALFGTVYGGITSNNIADYASTQMKQVLDQVKEIAENESHPLRNALNVYLAQEAVGIKGMLSRATGAIVNPNLELLFNGPTLRPFSFSFKMSPRSKDEADQVRSIIRFFKEGSSVRTANSNVFLKSPNIFKIQFLSGSQPHKSLPQIKECALTECSVDYTPDGTYMTYNDDAKTLTSYNLNLTFSELDPIYSDDYENTDSDIGY